MEFRHPNVIREELRRFIKIRHAIEDALRAPELSPDGAAVLEHQKVVTDGIIAALEWAACDRAEVMDDPRGEPHDASP